MNLQLSTSVIFEKEVRRLMALVNTGDKIPIITGIKFPHPPEK